MFSLTENNAQGLLPWHRCVAHETSFQGKTQNIQDEMLWLSIDLFMIYYLIGIWPCLPLSTALISTFVVTPSDALCVSLYGRCLVASPLRMWNPWQGHACTSLPGRVLGLKEKQVNGGIPPAFTQKTSPHSPGMGGCFPSSGCRGKNEMRSLPRWSWYHWSFLKEKGSKYHNYALYKE